MTMEKVKLNKYKLSRTSLSRLEGVDSMLVRVIKRALELSLIDFGVDWMGGYRTADEQLEIFQRGASTKDGFDKQSKHQTGLAVDFIPYVNGVISRDSHNYFLILGAIFIAAAEYGITIRSGADWDRDKEFITDQHFQDLGHIERIK